MNKIKYLLALIVFLATSCEIELKNDDTELPPELTVNALVSTDTILTATVTTATSFKEFTIDEYIDFADYQILLSSQHYGKSAVSVNFAG